MMMKILLVLSFCSEFPLTMSISNYGPFELTLKSIKFCKGPKKNDCCINTGRIINGTTLEYKLEVKENTTNIHGYMLALSGNKQTVKLQMKKLCDHPFWRPIMEKFIRFHNCYILKGSYHIVLNVQELAQKYFGGSFFYGEWTYKANMYNADCNFGCQSVEMSLTRKDS